MDAVEGQGGTQGAASWTPVISAFMLSHLANVMASGAKRSSGFKLSHHNACAKAINEKFSTKYTSVQVKNHLKTWTRKFQRLNKLKNMNAAGWDEDNFIITLDEEHYNNYVSTHKADAEYLNKPLEHYGLMQIIFGNSMATGKYAKDSSSNLGSENVDDENMDVETEELQEVEFSDASAVPTDHGATSTSRSRSKRARRAEIEEGMLAVFKDVGENIAKAIEKVAAPPPPPPTNDLPDDCLIWCKVFPVSNLLIMISILGIWWRILTLAGHSTRSHSVPSRHGSLHLCLRGFQGTERVYFYARTHLYVSMKNLLSICWRTLSVFCFYGLILVFLC